MNEDIFQPRPPVETVQVRIERTLKFVSRDLMDGYKALGGQTLEEADIDPDTPLPQATTQMLRAWAHSKDGVMGYLAQWGLMEKEVCLIHHVKVFVAGELVHEEDLALL